jgi:transposase
MFRFFGGVPRLVVIDNLKSGVQKASFCDPEINRSYGMMASHHGVGVLPARPRRPKDKAKVENGIRFAQTCILGRLRRQTFFSLAEANAAIADALDRINDHVVRRLGVTRRHLFETVERAALAPLPGDEHELAEWRLARVGVDYHVEHDGFFYSVPHGLIRAQVDLRATGRTIELFHRGKRVALHQRRYAGRRHGTDPGHMPSSHRRCADWTPDRFRRWAASVGHRAGGREPPQTPLDGAVNHAGLTADAIDGNIHDDPGATVQVAGFKSERWPASDWNHRPASSESARWCSRPHLSARGCADRRTRLAPPGGR